MNKKTVFSVAASTLFTTLAVVGVTYASTPAATDTSLLNKGTVKVDSLKVGKQDVGGVTFFNGTIVNSTTTSGNDNPVTIGDNVRIDGRVWRGETSGSGDSMPFIIQDDLKVEGSIEMNPSTKYEHVGRFDIIPSDTPQDYKITTADGFYNEDGSNGFYFAPVDFENGSTITNITSLYTDTSDANAMTVKLWSIKLADNTFTELATFDTVTGESAFSADVNLDVDLNNYAYVMSYDFGSVTDNSLAAKETRITYTSTMP